MRAHWPHTFLCELFSARCHEITVCVFSPQRNVAQSLSCSNRNLTLHRHFVLDLQQRSHLQLALSPARSIALAKTLGRASLHYFARLIVVQLDLLICLKPSCYLRLAIHSLPTYACADLFRALHAPISSTHSAYHTFQFTHLQPHIAYRHTMHAQRTA